MKTPAVADRIVAAAGIQPDDTVLEVGTGFGILTERLCQLAGQVISVESDAEIYRQACTNLSGIDNLQMYNKDGFSVRYTFDVFVSNLPYSQSRRAVQWLATVPFRCGAIMMQSEFARKITGDGKARRAVSVVWQECFEVTGSFGVGARNFNPRPQVDSVVLAFHQRKTISDDLIQAIHRLFSGRRRIKYQGRRLDQMSHAEILDAASG